MRRASILPILGFLGLFILDGRTDTAHHFIMPPPYGGHRHDKYLQLTRDATMIYSTPMVVASMMVTQVWGITHLKNLKIHTMYFPAIRMPVGPKSWTGSIHCRFQSLKSWKGLVPPVPSGGCTNVSSSPIMLYTMSHQLRHSLFSESALKLSCSTVFWKPSELNSVKAYTVNRACCKQWNQSSDFQNQIELNYKSHSNNTKYSWSLSLSK